MVCFLFDKRGVNTMIYQFCPIPIPLNFGYGIHSPGSFGIYSCAFMAHFNAPAFYADLEGFYANGHVGMVGKKLFQNEGCGMIYGCIYV